MILEGSKRGFLSKLVRDGGILQLHPVLLIECLARMGLPQQGGESFLLVARRPLALDFEGAHTILFHAKTQFDVFFYGNSVKF